MNFGQPFTSRGWLRLGWDLAKTRFRRSPTFQFSTKKKNFDENLWSRKSFFTFLGRFWRIYEQTDLKIKSLALFRSRCTYSEVCTTKKPQKMSVGRPKSNIRQRYRPLNIPPPSGAGYTGHETQKSRTFKERIKNLNFPKIQKYSKNNRKYGGSPVFSEKIDCFWISLDFLKIQVFVFFEFLDFEFHGL